MCARTWWCHTARVRVEPRRRAARAAAIRAPQRPSRSAASARGHPPPSHLPRHSQASGRKSPMCIETLNDAEQCAPASPYTSVVETSTNVFATCTDLSSSANAPAEPLECAASSVQSHSCVREVAQGRDGAQHSRTCHRGSTQNHMRAGYVPHAHGWGRSRAGGRKRNRPRHPPRACETDDGCERCATASRWVRVCRRIVSSGG